MTKYYLVTLAFRCHGQYDYTLETILICENPVDFLAETIRLLRDRETHIVFIVEITKEQYEQNHDLFE